MDRGRPPWLEGAVVLPKARRFRSMALTAGTLQLLALAIWRHVKRPSLDMSRMSACWDTERFGAICERCAAMQRTLPSSSHSDAKECATSVDTLEHSAHCGQSRVHHDRHFWMCLIVLTVFSHLLLQRSRQSSLFMTNSHKGSSLRSYSLLSAHNHQPAVIAGLRAPAHLHGHKSDFDLTPPP